LYRSPFVPADRVSSFAFRGCLPRSVGSGPSPAATKSRALVLGVCAVGLVCAWPSQADAYIGPGAGLALLSSFFGVLATIVLGLLSLLRWPFRAVRMALRRRRSGRRRLGADRVRRLIIVGFDGQDPRLTDAALKAGKLPHFAKLAKGGC